MDKNLELRRLYTQSFDDSEAFVDYFFRKLTSPDKVVALIRDGKTVSALHLLDRRIFLRGELFEMPFVVAAATVRELRGMRLLETVMRSAFERLYNEGKTFVALYPFSHAYYRKYGFVTYTKISRKEIKYRKDGETEIMPCTPLNMLKIYNRFCAGRQGYIVRQADTYEELLERWSVDNLTAYTVKKNRLEAYVVFSPLTGEIEEACGDTEVLDGVEELNGKTCPDFDGAAEEYAMTRLIDVKGALENIRYDRDGEFSFLLRDDFFPLNDGAYKLTVCGGNGTVEKVPAHDGLPRLGIEKLTLWIFGQGGADCPLLSPKKTFCIDKY